MKEKTVRDKQKPKVSSLKRQIYKLQTRLTKKKRVKCNPYWE